MKNVIIQEKPFGISIVPIEGIKRNNIHSKVEEVVGEITDFYIELTVNTKKTILCRGTEFKNLDTILTTGVDVKPSSSAIFCESFPQKPLEYGWNDRDENPRMILLFYNSEKLNRSYIETSSSLNQEDFNENVKFYPSIEYSSDGNKIWFSRLNNNDKRRATPYEGDYGYWIPMNPIDALVWVLIIGSFNEQEIFDTIKYIKNVTF